MMRSFMSWPKAFKSQDTGTTVTSPTTAFPPTNFRSLKLWSEKVAGQGEDAQPVILLSEDENFGAIAVFDGLGGSGAGRFDLSVGSLTGAQLAATLGSESFVKSIRDTWSKSTATKQRDSREHGLQELGIVKSETIVAERLPLAFRGELERRGLQLKAPQEAEPVAGGEAKIDAAGVQPQTNPSVEEFDAKMLAQNFDSAFTKAIERLGSQASASRIKSRSRRQLPTTFAGAVFSSNLGKTSIKAFWAGDSRVYFLTEQGLFQLTSDHARANSTGGLDLTGDAPLTRMLSEQVPNEIESCFMRDIGELGFVIACTDGAYAYFATAAHFELALWDALEKATQWEREVALAASIQAVTQDDTSLVMVPIGFRSDRPFVSRERISELDVRRKQFDEYGNELRRLKAQLGQLETDLEKLRQDMQARPASMLNAEV
jgi:serine/threonine protein phosphatase PrpC